MIIIGSDHSGIELKKRIIKYFDKNNILYFDISDFENQDGADYPDIAKMLYVELVLEYQLLVIK